MLRIWVAAHTYVYTKRRIIFYFASYKTHMSTVHVHTSAECFLLLGTLIPVFPTFLAATYLEEYNNGAGGLPLPPLEAKVALRFLGLFSVSLLGCWQIITKALDMRAVIAAGGCLHEGRGL